jgi:hypothetical protein
MVHEFLTVIGKDKGENRSLKGLGEVFWLVPLIGLV